MHSMTLLSHYTTRAGLKGIARGKTLWATRFSDLNDKTEMEYGFVELTISALRTAMGETEKLMQPYERRALDYEEAAAKLVAYFRSSFEGERSSEPLYVFSFAKGQTAEQERRGHLTLWDRYTAQKGYCLQYDREEVLQLLRRESQTNNYALLNLAAVQYGIDEADYDYRAILFQMAQPVLIEVAKGKPGLGLEPQYQKLWPFSTLATRMYHFFCVHKDPFFEDDRETRIVAVPAKKAESRVLTEIAFRKEVKTTPEGRRYIDVGADWDRGIEPRRIIVGPRASGQLDDVLELFERNPEVIVADFPIR